MNISFLNILFLLILLRGLLQSAYWYLGAFDSHILVIMRVVTLIVFILVLIYVIHNNKNIWKRSDIILIGLYSLLFISLLSNFSIKGLSDTLSYLLYPIFAIFLFIINRKTYDYKRIFLLIFFSVLLIQLFLYLSGFSDYRGTLGSLMGHANSANFLLAMISIFLISKKQYAKVLFLISIMVIVGGRSSLIALLIIVIFMIISLNRRKIIYVNIGFLVVLVFFSLLIFHAFHADWNDGARLFSLNSLKWRINHWLLFIFNAFENSFIYGVGVGSYQEFSISQIGVFSEVHNDFIKIFHDVGVIGLLLIVSLDIAIFRKFYSKATYSNKVAMLSILYVRYSYMFFDNLITNFLGTLVYLYILYILSNEKNY